MNPDLKKDKSTLLGEMLRELRKKHLYSQTTVAEYLGLDRSTYAKYELGRLPDVSVLAKIALLYNISIESLVSVFLPESEDGLSKTLELGSSDDKPCLCILTKEEQLVIDYYRNCSCKPDFMNFIQSTCLEQYNKDQPDN